MSRSYLNPGDEIEVNGRVFVLVEFTEGVTCTSDNTTISASVKFVQLIELQVENGTRNGPK